MDIVKVLNQRKSIRAYQSTPISDAVLLEVLDAARTAPSAGNVQPWHFIIVRDREKREKIATGCRYGKFLAESPVVVVACGDKRASSRWYAVETSIALEHIVLAATAHRLGTCWIGMFNEEDVRTLVNLPRNFEIIALVALGYPHQKLDLWAKILHTMRPKKKLSDILSWEIFGSKRNV